MARNVEHVSQKSDSATAREQAHERAHLRPLRRCQDCDRPATEQLYSGLNAPMDTYCDRHAPAALRRFKERS